MSDDNKTQYECTIAQKNSSSLIITVRDKKNSSKYSNVYTNALLKSKSLNQGIDKTEKLLKTALSGTKDNWSLRFGYYTNSGKSKKEKDKDNKQKYLSDSDVKLLRKKARLGDTLYIILNINEDFFSINTHFKLNIIADSNTKTAKKSSRRTLSNSVTKSNVLTLNGYDEQKIAEMEAKIKSLTRDNQVLARKLQKLSSTTGKKQKKIDNEREMRLNANKERFWLKQKLDRLQKAIAARLKILGIDFSKVTDITSALDVAFNVIQKLAKELQQKEEEYEDMKLKMNTAVKEATSFRKNKDKLNGTIEKQRGVMQDLRKQIDNRDRRLSVVSHDKLNKESALQKQLNDLQNEINALRIEKENIFDKSVDDKSKLKGELDDKISEIDELNKKILKLSGENVSLSAENDKLLNNNDILENKLNENQLKLEEALKEIKDLKLELENEKNKNNKLNKNNNKLILENKKLYDDLTRLKDLLDQANNKLLQLKSILDDTTDVVANIFKAKDKDLSSNSTSDDGQ